MVVMFHLTCLGWILFRSQSMSQATGFLGQILFQTHPGDSQAFHLAVQIVQITWLLWAVEIFQKVKEDLLIVFHWPVWARASLYFALFYYITLYGTSGQEFIYFQF